jgi:uncharacterized protein (DUF2252 family)
MSVAARIAAYNAGRTPARLERKYAAMRSDPFVFFRGAAHLFWEDWAKQASHLPASPLVWACGDLHLENFGSYLGDNRLVYFDLNDFDEAALGPATADLTRLLTSLRLAMTSLQLGHDEAAELTDDLVRAYQQALSFGKARWIERPTARGMVRDLLQSVRTRTTRSLLDRRTVIENGKRRLRIDGRRAVSLTLREREALLKGFNAYVDSIVPTGADARFYKPIDVATRIAGVGSLGIRRYVVLVRGHGSEDGRVLLDIKQVGPSCMASHLRVQQPVWKDDAHRVVEIQQRMQAIAPALLAPIKMGGATFVLRELQPTDDRVALANWNGKLSRLRKVVVTMAETLAWAQLRSASRNGSAGADALIDFGRDHKWHSAVRKYARQYSNQTIRYWREFRNAAERQAR